MSDDEETMRLLLLDLMCGYGIAVQRVNADGTIERIDPRDFWATNEKSPDSSSPSGPRFPVQEQG